MNYFKSFSELLKNQNDLDFPAAALELFHLQATHNPIYKAYLEARGINPSQVQDVEDIPFLPISFFKSHKVVSGLPENFLKFYSSSGTSGRNRSRHFVWSEQFYLENACRIFETTYGPLEDYHIMALLPDYLERKGSSLIAMVDYFIKKTKSGHSGFYLYNHGELLEKILQLRKDKKKILLIGVTFALLNLAESKWSFPACPNLLVMETGGMKGRRKEMVREEVHGVLKNAFGLEKIHSEYGMTELMSQAYSKGDGKFSLPYSMRVFLRETNDPLSYNKKSGGINVIDLANFHSCAFIETQDLGRWDEKGYLEILGRFDNSEIRGCNLMVN